jgi:pilus retraction protein PilT
MTQQPIKHPLQTYLSEMVERRASDVFLRADCPPVYRVNGRITRSQLPSPSKEDMQGYLDHVLTPIAIERFKLSPDIDVAYYLPAHGRFRINLFMHQGNLGLVARLIPTGSVEFETLNLPDSILKMVDSRSGLILVIGPTGCGKSTTMAALLHHINKTRHEHIVTIEDPIEFVHEEKECLIHQRQVGYDTESFKKALRHVVRQSPDVIMIGEMRDRDTMETALSAAMTGHLILSTLHTTNVVQSIDRILNYFPPEARPQAQTDLATSLVGLVTMRLLPRCDGEGRIPAVEILRSTPTVRKAIAENRLVEIYDIMKRSGDMGMMTLNQSLVKLCQDGYISEQDALIHAPNADEFRLNLQGMFTGIDSIDMRTEKMKEDETPAGWEKY